MPRPLTGQAAPLVRTDDVKDALDTAVAWAQVATALAALFGFPVLILQIRHARREGRLQRTAEILARWEDRATRREGSPVKAFLLVDSAEDCVERVRVWETRSHAEAQVLPRSSGGDGAPRASANDVIHYLNFFEDVAARYNQGEVLPEPLISSLGYAAFTELRGALWLIHCDRDGASGEENPLYREWELMVRDMRQVRAHGGRPWRPATPQTTREAIRHLKAQPSDPGIGFICLPERGTWTEPRTAQAKVITRRLATDEFRRRLEAVRDRPAIHGTEWRVLAIPHVLAADARDVAEARYTAQRLARRLDALGPDGLERFLREAAPRRPVWSS